jgi:hypothetical protein
LLMVMRKTILAVMDVPNLIAQLGTDAEAARKLDLDPSTVWRLRHSKTLPSHKTTLKLLALQEGALKRKR